MGGKDSISIKSFFYFCAKLITMNAFLDFIFASYVGGFIWLVTGAILLFAKKKKRSWTEPVSEGETFRRFLGICFIIMAIFILANLIYDTFHQV